MLKSFHCCSHCSYWFFSLWTNIKTVQQFPERPSDVFKFISPNWETNVWITRVRQAWNRSISRNTHSSSNPPPPEAVDCFQRNISRNILWSLSKATVEKCLNMKKKIWLHFQKWDFREVESFVLTLSDVTTDQQEEKLFFTGVWGRKRKWRRTPPFSYGPSDVGWMWRWCFRRSKHQASDLSIRWVKYLGLSCSVCGGGARRCLTWPRPPNQSILTQQ